MQSLFEKPCREPLFDLVCLHFQAPKWGPVPVLPASSAASAAVTGQAQEARPTTQHASFPEPAVLLAAPPGPTK